MISYLKWKVIEINFNSINILTQSWVWYEVWINQKIYEEIISSHDINLDFWVELFIYHYIWENSQNLFGFLNKTEKIIFSSLIKISWIWGKVAMQILSLWVENLISAVWIWDKQVIESIKWVGKKMAEKIIIELKDKDFWIVLNTQTNTKNNSHNLDIKNYEAIKQTLVNMWYQAKNIDTMLQKLPWDITNTWEILQWIIKEIS